jgi:hypothetical protein
MCPGWRGKSETGQSGDEKSINKTQYTTGTTMWYRTGAYVDGSGIEIGYTERWDKRASTSSAENHTISGGNITADCTGFLGSGSAIGPDGKNGASALENLRLSRNVIMRSTLLKASSILLSDGWFDFVIKKARVLSGTRLSSETEDFAILDSKVIGNNSQDFSWLNGLGDGGWLLCFCPLTFLISKLRRTHLEELPTLSR